MTCDLDSSNLHAQKYSGGQKLCTVSSHLSSWPSLLIYLSVVSRFLVLLAILSKGSSL